MSCNGGNNGALDLTVEGGTQPYFYHWSNNQSSQDLINLIAGNYSVTVTDNNNCSVSVNAFVLQPSVIAIQGTVANALCYNQNSGSISTTVSGGTAPYTYAWNSNHQAGNISNLSAGTYVVTVTDSRGCTQTAQFVVGQASQLTISGNITNASCYGAINGSINLTINGGTPMYSGVWSNNQSGLNATNLAIGDYVVTITDHNSCTATQTFHVSQPTQISANFDIVNTTCDLNNAEVTIIPQGGAPSYTYLWDANALSATTNHLTNLNDQEYFVTITDDNSCTFTTSVVIGRVVPPTVTISQVVNETCNLSNGSIATSTVDGNPPYQYQWIGSSSNQSELTNIAAGFYVVSVTDNDGCVDSASIVITNHEPQTVTIGEIIPAHCILPDGSASVIVSGGSGSYTFDWGVTPPRTNSTENNLYSGVYIVTVNDGVCNVPIEVTVPNIPGPTAIASVSPNYFAPLSRARFRFIDASENAVSWYWDFDDQHSSVNENPVHTYEESGTYQVILEVSDDFGCTDTTSITIIVTDDMQVWIPNAFTPNGDGHNDLFGPTAMGHAEGGYEFMIYDRWGQQVFYTTHYGEQWNGTINGVKVEINTAFVYVITIYDVLGKAYRYSGTISLIYAVE